MIVTSACCLMSLALLGQVDIRRGDRVFVQEDAVKLMDSEGVVTTLGRGQLLDVLNIDRRRLMVDVVKEFGTTRDNDSPPVSSSGNDLPPLRGWVEMRFVTKLVRGRPNTIKIVNPLQEQIHVRVQCPEHGWMYWDDDTRIRKITVPMGEQREKALSHAGRFRIVLENKDGMTTELGEFTLVEGQSISLVIKRAMIVKTKMDVCSSCGKRHVERQVHEYLYGAVQYD